MTTQTVQFMQRAIELAEKGLGRTSPNPPVGAVVVHGGNIVGEGFHPEAGKPHAEVFALQAAGDSVRGGDLYVTLEPCSHQGRTGPCADALIAAGIARVFVGTQDPNPQVAGRGLKRLREAGIDVHCGVLEEECRRLIAPFSKYVSYGLPYVVYKSAMTLDGQTATAAGDSKWISCSASRELVHQLRNHVDGIVVGAGTVKVDNPQLTTRLVDGGRDPARVVFDGRLETSPGSTVYTQLSEAATILVTSEDFTEETLHPYLAEGTEIIQVPCNVDGLDLRAALVALGKRGLHSLLLEGGGTLGGAMLRAGLVDRMMVFVAPKLLGGIGRSLFAGKGVASISEAFHLTDMRTSHVDTDILIEGEVQHVHRTD